MNQPRTMTILSNIVQMRLSKLFIEFLEANDINLEYYQRQLLIQIPRYIRLSLKVADVAATVEAIEDELKCKLNAVDWLPGFYSLPIDSKLSGCSYYDKGTPLASINDDCQDLYMVWILQVE